MCAKIFHYALVLGVICAGAMLAVGGVYNLTIDRINAQKALKKKAALALVLPQRTIRGPYPYLYQHKTYQIYTGCDPTTGRVNGWAVLTTAQGYSSILQVMIGVDSAARVIAIEIVDQAETPGLGAQCQATEPVCLSDLLQGKQPPRRRPAFQRQFNGKTFHNAVLAANAEEVSREGKIKRITGATITTNAVISCVQQALKVIAAYRRHKPVLQPQHGK